MTTELVLLLGLFAFLVGGAFFGEYGPFATFKKSGPMLGARLERHITIGREYRVKGGNFNQWQTPDKAPPDGQL